MKHVLLHEKSHLRRKDHLWKPLGFLLLSVYWFNPVIWVAYKSGTETEGVSIRLMSIDLEGDKPYIEIKLVNDTNNEPGVDARCRTLITYS